MAQHLWISLVYLHRLAVGRDVPLPVPPVEGSSLQPSGAAHVDRCDRSGAPMPIGLADADVQRFLEAEKCWMNNDEQICRCLEFFFFFQSDFLLENDGELFTVTFPEVWRGCLHESRAPVESGALTAKAAFLRWLPGGKRLSQSSNGIPWC